MAFRIISPIVDTEVIAEGRSLRIRRRLKKSYGGARWRKLKGLAIVELSDGRQTLVELHWYGAHGVGRREFKIKRLVTR